MIKVYDNSRLIILYIIIIYIYILYIYLFRKIIKIVIISIYIDHEIFHKSFIVSIMSFCHLNFLK
jgi:hypothetical protein